MNYMRSMKTALAAIAVTLLAAPAFAQVKPKVTGITGEPAQSLLWVGNSFFYFNNGINRHMTGLTNAAGKEGRLRSGTTSTRT